MGVGKHLWKWDASSPLTQHQRNPQHLKWLPGAGEEAAAETGAQGRWEARIKEWAAALHAGASQA